MSLPLTDEQRAELVQRASDAAAKCIADWINHKAGTGEQPLVAPMQAAVDALSDLLAAGLRVTGDKPPWWPTEAQLNEWWEDGSDPPFAVRALRWLQEGSNG